MIVIGADTHKLDRALHIIAITRGRLDPETRAYLQRKEAEGKSRMEAMRCLKRHLARRYYRLLSERSRSTALLPPEPLPAVELHRERIGR
jgi:transposase